MAIDRRFAISLAVFVLLAVFVAIGYWYQTKQVAPSQARDTAAIEFTNGEDRGPGSLREALFIAAAAKGQSTISIRTQRVALASALPPLVNPHGVRLIAAVQNAEIDASALPSGPVLDIAGAHVTIEGLRIRNCKAAGVLVRAADFAMRTSTVQGCDVGADIAENATEVLIERNRFVNNRVGVRFAGSNRNASVVKNEFTRHRDAGIWAVRADSGAGGNAVSIRENKFTKERIGILAANVATAIERNDLLGSRDAAIQLMGTGAVVRGNRVSGGAAMGIVAENSRGAVIEANEIAGVQAYGIMLKSSADALLKSNRVHNSGFGLAFVTGTSPSTAIDNTIIEPRFNGIDVIGDSPILRENHIVRPRALALKVVDFDAPDGRRVRSQPFLEGNNFDARGTIVTAENVSSGGKSAVRQ